MLRETGKSTCEFGVYFPRDSYANNNNKKTCRKIFRITENVEKLSVQFTSN